MRYLFLILVAAALGCGDGDRAVGPSGKELAVKGALSAAGSAGSAGQGQVGAEESCLTPVEARLALADLGIDYTERSFVRAAGRGDLVVVKLFVEAGMSIDDASDGEGTALAHARWGGQL